MSIYKGYTPEQQEELFSNFLIDSWSYSKVTAFARNEKAYEMNYIYGVYSKSSATTIAGQAYHHALQYYFSQLKDGVSIDLVELEQSAFQYLDDVKSNHWKIQKTTPTVEDCRNKSLSTVTLLLKNFIGEAGTYQDDIAEVLDVEVYGDEFLTINGVDIPLPCHFKIDLVVRTKSGKIAIIDHKSKATYTSDEEIALSIGIQAITYLKGYEAKTGRTVDEVWFAENKYSQNKDKSPQISIFKLEVDANTRRLYEALLYEPLKRMLEAVNNPDYTFLINESDNYVDKAELYDFWCRTMICEVEDFNVPESKKALIGKRLKKIKDSSQDMITTSVIKKFKENAEAFITYDLSNKDMTQSEKIEHSLRSLGIIIKVAHFIEGYSSDTYLLDVSAGVSVKSIFPKCLDIANALDVENVRMSNQLVKHQGKSYLSIDVAKKRTRDLLFDESRLEAQKIPLGIDNYGNLVYWDLQNQSTPHILICGTTGSGKSVCAEVIVEYAKLAEGIENIVILDPKYEFTKYKNTGIMVVQEIDEIEKTMRDLVEFMNKQIKEGKKSTTLVLFDEAADAIDQSKKGKELDIMEMVQIGNYADKKAGIFTIPGAPKMALKKTGELKSLEENLKMLLQKGRSCGIRVAALLQRASTKVIGGDAKVNFPVQICFKVQKKVDSMVVLDEEGAENLSGKGDGLIKSPEFNDTVRFQAFYKPEKVLA